MKFLFVLSYLLVYCESMPAYNVHDYPERNVQYSYGVQPRPLFGNPIGDWINNSEWFPIEINVIDLVTGISNGISGIFPNGLFGGNGLVQRIPIVHKWAYHDEPRPLRYFVLVPNHPNLNTEKLNNYNPFHGDANFFPHYP